MSTRIRPAFMTTIVLFAVCMIGLLAQTANAATYTVVNTNDSGAGSLRQAIADANVAAGADTIDFDTAGVFATPQTITLGGTLLTISDHLTINGTGASKLTIDGNNASIVFFVAANKTVALQAMSITGGVNPSANGGGIDNNFGNLSVIDCVISGNSAGNGAAIGTVGSLSLKNSTISNNSAIVSGGGIYNSGTLVISNSTISNNSAGYYGGGIFNSINSAALTVGNSTISENTAGSYGGGIYSSKPINISNSTITGNGSNAAGGIYASSINQLASTIVAGNFTGSGATASDISGVVVTASYNLVGDAASAGGITDGVNGNIVGADPKLGPLANNGGPTRTRGLLFGSPAIDKGKNFGAVSNDQRGSGFARVINDANVANADDGTDIGAVESNYLTVNTTAQDDDGACQPLSDGDCTLREAILAANAALGTETIVFDIPSSDPGYDAVADRYTITLTSVLPDLQSNMSINGLGAKRLTVKRGSGFFRIFKINNGTTVSIAGLTISGGFADEGGGIRNMGTLSITGSVIRDNLTFDGPEYFCNTASLNAKDGGGIYNGGSLTIDSSTFIGNRTGKGGPGSDGSCAFEPGNGGNGGAIGNHSGTVTIRNSTFSGNRTGNGGDPAALGGKGGDGGAIYNTGSLSISNTTINTNILGTGGRGSVFNDPYATGPFDLSGSIIANMVGQFDVYGSVSSGDYNLVTNPAGALAGTHNIVGVDPMLGPLADNGGPTPTYALLCGSPAIDAGISGGFPNDQRRSGFARKFDDPAMANAANGDGTDIGAFELQAPLVCNTAPVANDDAYSTNEDTVLDVAAPGIFANDTDNEGGPFSVILNVPPSHGILLINDDGSINYKPHANFNGTDSFVYRIDDTGGLESNPATVTIIVNPVNDAPTISLTTPSTQSVQYSDPIAEIGTSASDVDTESSLSIKSAYSFNGGSFVTNALPAGIVGGSSCSLGSDGITRCTTVLTGRALVPTGVYTIRITVSDGVLSNYVDHVLTVSKECAATEYTGDAYALTAGPTVTSAMVRLAAQVTQQADGFPGDITTAKISFLLFKSANLGSTPDMTISGIPVDSSGSVLTFANLPVDTWVVKVKIDAANQYWKASPVGMGTITIEQPTTELRTSGGGWVPDPQSSNGKGNFGFNVANQKKGLRGSSIYLFRDLNGFNYLVKSTSWQSGGIGFSSEGSIVSKAAFSGKCVVQKIDPNTGEVVESLGNYSFTVDARDGDLFNPRQSDKYAITVLRSDGLLWRQIGSRTNPPAIGGGNITVKAR